MRRLILITSLLALLATTPTALAATGDPQKKHTAKDQAAARAIVTKQTELPGSGWKVLPGSDSGGNPKCGSYSLDLSDLTETGLRDVTFEHGLTQINTAVSLFLTSQQAEIAYTRLASPRLANCLGKWYAASATKERPSTHPKVGAARSLKFSPAISEVKGYRFTFSFTTGGRTIPAHVDYAVLRRDRAIALFLVVQALQPFPVTIERDLITAVADRMN